jgi:hypothetical protein
MTPSPTLQDNLQKGNAMLRTFVACAVSAAVTACLTAGVRLGARSSTHAIKNIAVRETAIFAGQDLLCVNEPATGYPPHLSGVTCSSYAKPYRGLGVWITRTALQVTSPPSKTVVFAHHR